MKLICKLLQEVVLLTWIPESSRPIKNHAPSGFVSGKSLFPWEKQSIYTPEHNNGGLEDDFPLQTADF